MWMAVGSVRRVGVRWKITRANDLAAGPLNWNAPIRTRIKRSVGWPIAAVSRRTWRFFPSISPSDPAGGDGFANAGWAGRGWEPPAALQHPRMARKRLAARRQALCKFLQRAGCGDSFNLCPILAFVRVPRCNNLSFSSGSSLSRSKLQSRVKPPNRVNIFGNPKSASGIGEPSEVNCERTP